MKSLKASGHQLANVAVQLQTLQSEVADRLQLPLFHEKLQAAGLFPLSIVEPAVFQINLGKMCNQVCKHCHVDAGPDRKEIMTRETMQACLDALAQTSIPTVDLTGGAPEMVCGRSPETGSQGDGPLQPDDYCRQSQIQ